MTFARNVLVIFSCTLFATGCVTTTIVQKPAVERVHKIAIISLYAPATIRNEDGPSATEKASGWAATLGMSGKGGSKDGEGGKSLIDFGGTRLVDAGLAEIRTQLASFKNWQVLDPKTYVNTPAFVAFNNEAEKRAVKQLGFIGGLGRKQYVTPEGLPLIMLGAQKTEDKKEWVALAKAIGADALAFVSMRMSYRPSTSIGGNGTASLLVVTDLDVVTPDGEYAIKAPSQGIKSMSDDTVGMVAGSILFDQKTESLFRDTVKKTAAVYQERIAKEL